MEAEIGPKLTSLREKRRDFVEYQKLENELGQLQRFLVAYEYYYSKVSTKESSCVILGFLTHTIRKLC
jgi:chromosome segregation ATPase